MNKLLFKKIVDAAVYAAAILIVPKLLHGWAAI